MRWYAALMRGCGALAAAVIGVITLLVCFDVLGRNLGFGSLPWLLEVTEYAMPVVTLAAAPWLMWRNAHVRLDLLGAVLSPSAQRQVDRLSAAAGLVVCLLFVWYGVATLLDLRQAGSLVMKALVFPEWWLYVSVPIGFALLGMECARRVLWPSGLTEVSPPPENTTP
ncbi:MAG: TRAP transporter small permease [Rubrivivax sp.]|jgi:TRAP-type C4-dicarboxylate transport system permease small subunit